MLSCAVHWKYHVIFYNAGNCMDFLTLSHGHDLSTKCLTEENVNKKPSCR